MTHTRRDQREKWRGWLLTSALVFMGTEAFAQGVETCRGLGPALTEHSCFHSEFGPFTSVLATSGGTPTSTTPAIDAVHTEFRVALTPSVESVVTYTPARTGQWVVFLGEDLPFELRDAKGEAFSSLYEAFGTTGCAALSVARAFALTAGETYSFVFRPRGQRSVVTVVEYANDFLQSHGRDRDGDGYGDPLELSAPTVCFPAEGYSAKLGDCDDEDPEIHPGAAEVCDGVDQNCNGVADDVGLRCSQGRGACASIGKYACPEEGKLVVCDVAEERLPAAEVCNGIDDDCNGIIDDGESLCVEDGAFTCVREETRAFCGCLLDIDCGPPEGGMTCEVGTRRCVSGCSTAAGNNGCPSGQRCVVESGESTGDCRAEDEVPDEPEPEPTPEPDGDLANEGGCSCQTGPGGAPGGATWFAVLALLGVIVFRRRRARFGSAGLLSLFLSACGGTTIEDSGNGDAGGAADRPEAPGEDCTPLLAEAPAKHACSHGMNGPFEDVVGAVDEKAGALVDRVHIPYWIEVRGGAGASGWVSYRAARAGEHVIFTSGASTVTGVRQGGGRVVVTRVERSDSCSVFDEAHRVTLERDELYFFRVAVSAQEPVLWFVEHLGAFGKDAWFELCED